MRVIANKSNESSSSNTSVQNQNKSRGRGGDDLEIVEVFLTGSACALSVENGIAASFRVFNVSDYHHVYYCVRIKQIEDPDILLRDFGLLQLTSSRA